MKITKYPIIICKLYLWTHMIDAYIQSNSVVSVCLCVLLWFPEEESRKIE